jgi:predicted ribosomally synthesized peptide with SipW-like signal peptide
MKRFLIGTLTAGAVAAVTILATGAFFSDQEKSVGNTFQAGKLDLSFQVGGGTSWTDVNGAPLFDGVTFPLGDLKPGDKGEKTVKLWVDDNPSCGKVSVNVTEDKDNDCTEPEGIDEGGATPSCTPEGELNDQVNFAVWVDPNCNNVLDTGTLGSCERNDPENIQCDGLDQARCEVLTEECKWVPGTPGESILVSGPIDGSKAYSVGELPLTQANAQCYGIAYCFGTWNGTTCDGAAVNNTAQSDSFKADLIIDALQQRNQFPNGCPKAGDWPVLD